MRTRLLSSVMTAALASACSLSTPVLADEGYESGDIKHVLLISIDGMHSLDFINCSAGVPGVNGGAPYCPSLAALKATGRNYLDASTPRPSDSFPGIMAIVSGGSPRTVGAFYDVAYDRSLQAPAITTGNGVQAGSCTPNQTPTGTTTEYEEGDDLDQSKLNGGAPAGVDGGIASIDPKKLPRDPKNNCQPVWPWNFVRTNTIFGVVHAAGGYTAWADKHPTYAAVGGPGDGSNLNDYYAPEINSIPVPLPVKFGNVDCSKQLPDQYAATANDDYTTSFKNIQCYDALKANAVLNEIKGMTHDGQHKAPVPNLLGMNFQAVSIGQKLIQKSLPTPVSGGYSDNAGTPTPALLDEIKFVDAEIGQMVSTLKSNGLYNSTLIVVTAKHGQSPIDTSRYTPMKSTSVVTTSPAGILANAGCLPDSESPLGSGIGPTEDDISLIWLNSSCTAASAVSQLETQSPATNNIAGIGQIFSGPAITQLYNDPKSDSRTPDIIVTPNVGVTYSGSGKKHAEHGGFAHDDTNVIMLLSNPHLKPATVTASVTTMQVAPTVLEALGLDPDALQAVRLEGTQALPGFASK
jgi:hypothetical protein